MFQPPESSAVVHHEQLRSFCELITASVRVDVWDDSGIQGGYRKARKMVCSIKCRDLCNIGRDSFRVDGGDMILAQ